MNKPPFPVMLRPALVKNLKENNAINVKTRNPEHPLLRNHHSCAPESFEDSLMLVNCFHFWFRMRREREIDVWTSTECLGNLGFVLRWDVH